VVIRKPAGATAIESEAVIETDAPSITLTVKLLDPAVVGVPEMAPLDASVRPPGSDPVAMLHA
jgi:hypothetical protein